MTKKLVLTLIIAFGLCGCASFRQFPKRPGMLLEKENYEAALCELDEEYAKLVSDIYGDKPQSDCKKNKSLDPAEAKHINDPPQPGTGTVGTAQKEPVPPELLRNGMIERRMVVIDAYYKKFQECLVQESVGTDFWISLAGIGVGGVGSFVGQTTSQILSAVNSGLSGGQAVYGRAVLYEKATSALVAQMEASRKQMRAKILEGCRQPITQYPLWMARTDLDAYYFAGSIPGAIIAIASQAKEQENTAENDLRDGIGNKTVRAKLIQSIDSLDGGKAKKLVDEITKRAPDHRSFAQAKGTFEGNYTQTKRDNDNDGRYAKEALRLAVETWVYSVEDAKKWEEVINLVITQNP